MSAQNQAPTLHIDQLLTVAINGLDRSFFKAHKDKAKKLYKEINSGKTVDFGNINFNDPKAESINVKLSLDHSEFVGHLTFHIFKVALHATMNKLAQRIQKKEDLNILTSKQTPEILIHTPGGVQVGDTVNVMVFGIIPSKNTATIKIQFVDPRQYQEALMGDANEDKGVTSE